jgi:hypothetical protein
MASTELSVLFTSKGDLQNDLSSLRKELQGVQKDIKAATDAGDTGKVEALSRDYAELQGKIDATRHSLKRVNGEIKKTTSDGAKSTSKLQAAWKKLQGVMRNPLFTAATIAGVTLFGKRAVEAFARAEQSQMKLIQAYQKFENIGDVPIQAVRDLASELQTLSGTDDDLLAAAAATMAQFGLTGDAILRVLPLVNDYAIYTGRDVTDAATTVGKALMGNARALKEIGINFRSTGDSAKDLEQIMALLEAQVGGTGKAYGETAQGGLARAQAAFSDLQETIGGTLVPALTAMLRVVEPAAAFFINLPGPIRGVAIAIGVLSAAALAIGPRLATMVIGLKAAGVEATAMKGKMAAAGGFLTGPWGAALAVATVALTYFITKNAEAEAAIQSFADNVDSATGKLNAAGVDMVLDRLLTEINADDWKRLNEIGFTVNEVAAAVVHGGAAWDDYQKKLTAKTPIRAAGNENARLVRSLTTASSKLRSETTEAMKREALRVGVLEDVTEAQRDVAYTSGTVTSALRNARQETGLYRDAAYSASYAASALKTANQAAADATDNLTNGLADLQSEIGRQQAIASYQTALDEFIAQPSQETALAVSSAMITAADAFEDPSEKAKFTKRAVDDIRTAAQDAGMKLNPELDAGLGRARGQAKLLETQIDRAVRARIVDITLRFNDSRATYGGSSSTGSDANGDWNGGYVKGPGTATSDSIRMRLSNGEFVMRAAAVRAIGVDKLYRMNAEKAVDPALIERAEVQGHTGPLIGQVVVNNPSENVDVEAAVATALRRAERRRKERG